MRQTSGETKNICRTKRTSGEQDKCQENSTIVIRTGQTSGKQEKHQENEKNIWSLVPDVWFQTNNRRLRQMSGRRLTSEEPDKHWENRTNVRRTRKTSGAQGTHQKKKTQTSGEQDKNRGTRQTSSERDKHQKNRTHVR